MAPPSGAVEWSEEDEARADEDWEYSMSNDALEDSQSDGQDGRDVVSPPESDRSADRPSDASAPAQQRRARRPPTPPPRRAPALAGPPVDFPSPPRAQSPSSDFSYLADNFRVSTASVSAPLAAPPSPATPPLAAASPADPVRFQLMAAEAPLSVSAQQRRVRTAWAAARYKRHSAGHGRAFPVSAGAGASETQLGCDPVTAARRGLTAAQRVQLFRALLRSFVLGRPLSELQRDPMWRASASVDEHSVDPSTEPSASIRMSSADAAHPRVGADGQDNTGGLSARSNSSTELGPVAVAAAQQDDRPRPSRTSSIQSVHSSQSSDVPASERFPRALSAVSEEHDSESSWSEADDDDEAALLAVDAHAGSPSRSPVDAQRARGTGSVPPLTLPSTLSRAATVEPASAAPKPSPPSASPEPRQSPLASPEHSPRSPPSNGTPLPHALAAAAACITGPRVRRRLDSLRVYGRHWQRWLAYYSGLHVPAGTSAEVALSTLRNTRERALAAAQAPVEAQRAWAALTTHRWGVAMTVPRPGRDRVQWLRATEAALDARVDHMCQLRAEALQRRHEQEAALAAAAADAALALRQSGIVALQRARAMASTSAARAAQCAWQGVAGPFGTSLGAAAGLGGVEDAALLDLRGELVEADSDDEYSISDDSESSSLSGYSMFSGDSSATGQSMASGLSGFTALLQPRSQYGLVDDSAQPARVPAMPLTADEEEAIFAAEEVIAAAVNDDTAANLADTLAEVESGNWRASILPEPPRRSLWRSFKNLFRSKATLEREAAAAQMPTPLSASPYVFELDYRPALERLLRALATGAAPQDEDEMPPAVSLLLEAMRADATWPAALAGWRSAPSVRAAEAEDEDAWLDDVGSVVSFASETGLANARSNPEDSARTMQSESLPPAPVPSVIALSAAALPPPLMIPRGSGSVMSSPVAAQLAPAPIPLYAVADALRGDAPAAQDFAGTSLVDAPLALLRSRLAEWSALPVDAAPDEADHEAAEKAFPFAPLTERHFDALRLDDGWSVTGAHAASGQLFATPVFSQQECMSLMTSELVARYGRYLRAASSERMRRLRTRLFAKTDWLSIMGQRRAFMAVFAAAAATLRKSSRPMEEVLAAARALCVAALTRARDSFSDARMRTFALDNATGEKTDPESPVKPAPVQRALDTYKDLMGKNSAEPMTGVGYLHAEALCRAALHRLDELETQVRRRRAAFEAFVTLDDADDGDGALPAPVLASRPVALPLEAADTTTADTATSTILRDVPLPMDAAELAHMLAAHAASARSAVWCWPSSSAAACAPAWAAAPRRWTAATRRPTTTTT